MFYIMECKELKYMGAPMKTRKNKLYKFIQRNTFEIFMVVMVLLYVLVYEAKIDYANLNWLF